MENTNSRLLKPLLEAGYQLSLGKDGFVCNLFWLVYRYIVHCAGCGLFNCSPAVDAPVGAEIGCWGHLHAAVGLDVVDFPVEFLLVAGALVAQ